MSTSSKTRLASIHDFGAKLRQPSLLQTLREYIEWQTAIRNAENPEPLYSQGPDAGPVSINLDLTTACNYACDHCVDMDILNTGIKHRYDELKESLDLMWKKGLRSVILIGGGEPTVDPYFEEIVHFLKDRDMHIAVVTNGSGMKKIEKVAARFGPKDWVRLSLDSGTDDTFQRMHKPKKAITLEQICADIPPVKAVNPNLRIGFSFIVTWKGAHTNDTDIVENLDEIVAATTLARDHQFDYISVKPFLVRAEANNAEIVGMDDSSKSFDAIIARIRAGVNEAKKLETDTFKVVESTNLRVMEDKSYKDYTRQPKTCHMTFFRQVLSPLGLFNCPVYRHVPQARIGAMNAFLPAVFPTTKESTGRLIHKFNAESECREVTCLYNEANWFIEDLILHPEKLDDLQAAPEREDFFL